MSMAGLRWAREIRGITSTQKLVLFALADMANDAGECWPSASVLAADCCLSERAVRSAFDALEAIGLLTGERALGYATRWGVNIGAVPDFDALPAKASPPEKAEVGRNEVPVSPEQDSGPPRNEVQDPPEPASDRTLNNPQLNPHESPEREMPHVGEAEVDLLGDRPSSKAERDNELLEEAVEIWNEVGGKAGLVRCLALTDKRKAALRSRLRKDFGNDLTKWRAFVQAIASSPWHTGENARGWRADFKFAMKPDVVVEFRERRRLEREREMGKAA